MQTNTFLHSIFILLEDWKRESFEEGNFKKVPSQAKLNGAIFSKKIACPTRGILNSIHIFSGL